MDNVQGLSELEAFVAKLNSGLEASLPGIVAEGGKVFEVEIGARAPRLTGGMVGNLDTTVSHSKGEATATVQIEHSGKGGDEHHAIFVEYGTSKMSAEPFFRPGMAAALPKAEALVTARLASEINSRSRK